MPNLNLPFSKIRQTGKLFFLSGEMPFAEDGTIPAGITRQTALTLERIAATLKLKGLSLDDIVSVSVFLTNQSDFAALNEEYKKYFKQPYPVRTTVCTALMAAALLEITVIAEAKD